MKHWKKGRYYITEIVSPQGKRQFWISRLNSITAIYGWTHISDEDDKYQFENITGYLVLYNMRVDGKQYVDEYNKDLEEPLEVLND